MYNQELAQIFYEIADYLEMEETAFKPAAYRKVAVVLDNLDEDAGIIYNKKGFKGLEDIPGVGKNIAEKIEEYIKTGKIKYYQELKKKTPVDIKELLAVEGIGPKKIKTLYQKLRIKNLKDLEKAARSHKIASLFNFGEKTEKNILESIAFLKRSKGRFLLGDILPEVKGIVSQLKELKETKKIDIAGSIRRKKETIGDADILAVSENPSKVMDFFISMPEVLKIWGKGLTRSSVRLKQGFDCDLRIVPEKSYGAALQYFTGSKEHNIALRKIAIQKGLKLNEYGLFKGKRIIAGKEEKEIYKTLGMDWIVPELRENSGEIEAARNKKLPDIIKYNDIKGDLHVHSNWDGGDNFIQELADQAIKMGYEYLGISDHTKFLKIENGLDEKKLNQQRKEIDKLNFQFSIFNFQILQGAETNILNNGSLDIKDEALKKLDYVIAGVHSSFKMPKEKMTNRIIAAMKNPYVRIISHPTGRILKKRDEYECDFDKILKAAKEYNVILEINAFPERLDLNDINIRKAKEAGVKMVINTDSHQKNQLKFMEFGIAQARRAWAEKEDIINAWPLEKILKNLSLKK